MIARLCFVCITTSHIDGSRFEESPFPKATLMLSIVTLKRFPRLLHSNIFA